MQSYTVTELTQYLRISLERDQALNNLWVSGETSNLTRSAAGHCYFTLKEATASIRCVLFKGQTGSEHLSNGNQVNAHGRISFYVTRGEVQLYIDMVQPAGLGVLAAEFERLKSQLEQEGLFDLSRKRGIPSFPSRIGVATSETGAVFHDICTVIKRRYPIAEIVFCPTAVQGNEAPGQLAQAIRVLNATEDLDVIILGRGGGSLEDLWAFNTESVARAIYGSKVPVISAVGHETDFTIADFVADMRAPTPSAAAEAVTPDIETILTEIKFLMTRSINTIFHIMADKSRSLEFVINQMYDRIPHFADHRQQIDDLLSHAHQITTTTLTRKGEQVEGLKASLMALNPASVLARGYAVISTHDRASRISSIQNVSNGNQLKVTVKDGSFEVQVNEPMIQPYVDPLDSSRNSVQDGYTNNSQRPKRPTKRANYDEQQASLL
jgi:exodeoxyribonuclease VII large subunit